MTGIFMTGYSPPVDVERKGIIVEVFLNRHRKQKEGTCLKLEDLAYLKELEDEGLLTERNGCDIQKLTRDGILTATSPGGYVGKKYEEYKKFVDGEESRKLDIEIKQKQLEQLEQKAPVRKIKPNKPLTVKDFESLITNSESTTLDFKREMYNFDNDNDEKKIAKFVKDVISFCNTVRTEPSYIIIGIGINEDGSKDMLGLDKNYDDSILQAKVKNKVFPIPAFSYYTIIYLNKTYGIFQFPITKYDQPLTPTVKLKGLVVGMPYHRNGSSNEEAIGSMTIHINDWLRGLPQISDNEVGSGEEIKQLLQKATDVETRLSELFSETLIVAKEHNFTELLNFCTNELKGIHKEVLEANTDFFHYRIQEICFSMGKYVPNRNFTTTSIDIKNYLKDEKNYFEYRLLFTNPITEIESYLIRLKGDTAYTCIDKDVSEIAPTLSGYDVTLYMFFETYFHLYKRIRQKYIDLLIAA